MNEFVSVLEVNDCIYGTLNAELMCNRTALFKIKSFFKNIWCRTLPEISHFKCIELYFH